MWLHVARGAVIGAVLPVHLPSGLYAGISQVPVLTVRPVSRHSCKSRPRLLLPFWVLFCQLPGQKLWTAAPFLSPPSLLSPSFHGIEWQKNLHNYWQCLSCDCCGSRSSDNRSTRTKYYTFTTSTWVEHRGSLFEYAPKSNMSVDVNMRRRGSLSDMFV